MKARYAVLAAVLSMSLLPACSNSDGDDDLIIAGGASGGSGGSAGTGGSGGAGGVAGSGGAGGAGAVGGSGGTAGGGGAGGSTGAGGTGGLGGGAGTGGAGGTAGAGGSGGTGGFAGPGGSGGKRRNWRRVWKRCGWWYGRLQRVAVERAEAREPADRVVSPALAVQVDRRAAVVSAVSRLRRLAQGRPACPRRSFLRRQPAAPDHRPGLARQYLDREPDSLGRIDRACDFLPLTDHRTFDQHYDPQWRSDKLLSDYRRGSQQQSARDRARRAWT